MKMFGAKSMSAILYRLGRVVSIGLLVFVLFVLISWIMEYLVLDNEGNFSMAIPLTGMQIKGVYSVFTLVSILTTLSFYIVFVYLLSLIFKVFTHEPLFTADAVVYLRYFILYNLLGPLVAVVGVSLFLGELSFDQVMVWVLHSIIALFAAFISAIFKKGVVLQEENNLTI